MMAEACMDGAVTGALFARDRVVRVSARLGEHGDAARAANANGGAVVIGRALRRQIEGLAMIEGRAFVGDIEKACRQALENAHGASLPGAPDPNPKDVAKLLRAALGQFVEEVPKAEAVKFATKAVRAKTKAEYFRKRVRAAAWKQYRLELEERKRKGKKVTRLKKHQADARVRTAWNRAMNTTTVVKGIENDAVGGFVFSLGSARQHTDTCAAHEGMVVRKGDRRLALLRPPLHWGCKSRWVPLLKAEMKRHKIKPYTPPETKEPEAQPAPGFGGFGK